MQKTELQTLIWTLEDIERVLPSVTLSGGNGSNTTAAVVYAKDKLEKLLAALNADSQ